MEIVIAPMTLADLDRVMEIEHYCFPTPWDRSAYEHDVRNPSHSRFYTAKTPEGDIAGYIGNWFVADECHVGTIATAHGFRRRGIAKTLILHTAAQALTERLSHMILEVRVTNTAAITLYDGLGFKIVGIRKGYYQDTGEDAHLMMHSDLAMLAGIGVSRE